METSSALRSKVMFLSWPTIEIEKQTRLRVIWCTNKSKTITFLKAPDKLHYSLIHSLYQREKAQGVRQLQHLWVLRPGPREEVDQCLQEPGAWEEGNQEKGESLESLTQDWESHLCSTSDKCYDQEARYTKQLFLKERFTLSNSFLT